MPDERIILQADEVAVIQIALEALMDDLKAGLKEKLFNAEAVTHMNQIMEHAKSALAKMEKISGHSLQMVQYKPGDEDEFLIKK